MTRSVLSAVWPAPSLRLAVPRQARGAADPRRHGTPKRNARARPRLADAKGQGGGRLREARVLRTAPPPRRDMPHAAWCASCAPRSGFWCGFGAPRSARARQSPARAQGSSEGYKRSVAAPGRPSLCARARVPRRARAQRRALCLPPGAAPAPRRRPMRARARTAPTLRQPRLARCQALRLECARSRPRAARGRSPA